MMYLLRNKQDVYTVKTVTPAHAVMVEADTIASDLGDNQPDLMATPVHDCIFDVIFRSGDTDEQQVKRIQETLRGYV